MRLLSACLRQSALHKRLYRGSKRMSWSRVVTGSGWTHYAPHHTETWAVHVSLGEGNTGNPYAQRQSATIPQIGEFCFVTVGGGREGGRGASSLSAEAQRKAIENICPVRPGVKKQSEVDGTHTVPLLPLLQPLSPTKVPKINTTHACPKKTKGNKGSFGAEMGTLAFGRGCWRTWRRLPKHNRRGDFRKHGRKKDGRRRKPC